MTRSRIESPTYLESAGIVRLPVDERDARIARYSAAAIALSIAEAAIPSPLPGVKPGLGNIVVLIVLLRHGWREAAWVSLLRVLAASLLTGQFLAPGFFLALAGALGSLAMLLGAQSLPRRWFGAVSCSILAAFAHIAAQLLLARLWWVPHDGVFLLAPILAASALMFGLINGLIVARLISESS